MIQYKRAKLEKWAPYLNSNGLVCRLTTYEDAECKGHGPGGGAGGLHPPTCCVALGTSLPLSQRECGPCWPLCSGNGGTEAGQLAWLQ